MLDSMTQSFSITWMVIKLIVPHRGAKVPPVLQELMPMHGDRCVLHSSKLQTTSASVDCHIRTQPVDSEGLVGFVAC